ncbi:MAG: low molecular weight phosphotyrosine protein phosphatase [Sulfuricellaceae bacterium]|nr:low molecular weight phosphotyrosine protein phosphatase [Sulfuricellaceae bacterium]
MKEVSVLFICMGNICRSPTAEGVFHSMVELAGLSQFIRIDSAGTHNYHIGEAPDLRSQAAASERGYDLSRLRGRQVNNEDFYLFDYILAMDRANMAELRRLCSPEHQYKLQLFLKFSQKYIENEVPDPYYGGAQGFEHVLNLVEDASAGLLQDILIKKPA